MRIYEKCRKNMENILNNVAKDVYNIKKKTKSGV